VKSVSLEANARNKKCVTTLANKVFNQCDNHNFSVTETAYHNRNRRILLKGVFSEVRGTSAMKWNNNNNYNSQVLGLDRPVMALTNSLLRGLTSCLLPPGQ
jgi:hypothetical protein